MTSNIDVLEQRISDLAASLGTGYQVAKGTAPVKLDANESPFPIDDAVWSEAVARVRAHGVHRYPPSQQVLTERLSDYATVSPEQLVLGNGSDELIQVLCRIFAQAGGVAVYPRPTFGFYASACLGAGLDTVEVMGNPDLRFPTGALEAEVNRLRLEKPERPVLLFVCRPNNPTGDSCDADWVAHMASLDGVWVALDEAYWEFSGENLVGLLDDLPRLFIFRTLSKAFGLAGLRLGYMLSAPDRIAAVRACLQPYNVNLLTLTVGELLLEPNRIRLMQSRAGEIAAARKEIEHELVAFHAGLEPLPSSANFSLVRVHPLEDERNMQIFDGAERAKRLHAHLASNGIAIRAFPWEPILKNCLRITVGNAEENERLLAGISDFIELEGGRA